MRQLYRLSITHKLALVFVLFAALLLAGVGLLAYQSGQAALQAATVSDLVSTSLEKQAAFEAWLEHQQSHLTVLASSPSVLGFAADLNATRPGSAEARLAHDHLVNELQVLTTADGAYRAVFVLDPHTGRAIASTDPQAEGISHASSAYFINGQHSSYLTDVYTLPEEQVVLTTVATPLVSPNGQLLGVLVGHLKLDELNAIIQRRTGLHQTDDFFLVNTANRFVTQPRLVPDPAVLQYEVRTEPIRRCLAGETGSILADDYRGIPVIAVYRWLAERQLCLIVKVEQQEALAPTHALGQTLLLVGGLVLLLGALLAVGLSQLITRPVRTLQAGAERLGRGDWQVRLPEARQDELGRLAHAFNQMAASLAENERQLRAHAIELERRVEERTAALRQQREWLRVTLTSIGDAVLATDTAGRITFLNPVAEALTGWSADAAQGQAVEAVFHVVDEQTAQPAENIVERVLREGCIVNLANHTALVTRDGGLAPIEDSAAPIRDGSGNVSGVVLVFHDVAEKRRAEETLRTSQEDLNHAQAVAHTGSWRLDVGRDELLWSDETHRMFGIPKGAPLTYATFLAAVHPDDRDVVDRAWQTALRGELYDIEHRILVADTVRWVHERAELEFDPQGTLLGGFGAVQDITERKQTEEVLRRYDLLASHSRDIILFMRRDDGRILEANDAALAAYGYSREELLALTIKDLRAPDALALTADQMSEADSQGILFETVHRRKDGSTFPAEVSSQGAIIGGAHTLISVIRDITERRCAEEEIHRLNAALEQRVTERTAQLAAANERLRHLDRLKSKFVSDVSHELRTPATNIHLYLNLLERGRPDKREQYQSILGEQVARLVNLIEDITELSHLELDILSAAAGQVDLNAVVDQVVTQLQSHASAAGLTLTFEPAANLPLVRAAREQLSRAAASLVMNALSYTAQGQVRVSTRHTPDRVYLEVQDTGRGIEPEDLPHLFERFYRGQNVSHIPGNGLGLALVNQIVEMHGGRTEVESQVGVGSTFRVWLPVGAIETREGVLTS
ncbi:MAG TPA: PAS domain S-box protein [Anaerolineae bacterium]|nr:PAS domain S-box protein [Anaerolineae bacterium]